MWASILGVDPLPHRPSGRGELACLVSCMVPMAMIALRLGVAHEPVYGHYLGTLGLAGLDDQRLAAAIMAGAVCLPLRCQRWHACESSRGSGQWPPTNSPT
jgi:cytochrome c oxidase assembly factor CtaG